MEVGGNLVKVSLDFKPTTTQSQDFVTSDLVESLDFFPEFWLQKNPQISWVFFEKKSNIFWFIAGFIPSTKKTSLDFDDFLAPVRAEWQHF